jgi:hypothetical protein
MRSLDALCANNVLKINKTRFTIQKSWPLQNIQGRLYTWARGHHASPPAGHCHCQCQQRQSNSPCSHPHRCRVGPSGTLEPVLYFWPEFWLLFRVTPTHNKKNKKTKKDKLLKTATNLEISTVYLSPRFQTRFFARDKTTTTTTTDQVFSSCIRCYLWHKQNLNTGSLFESKHQTQHRQAAVTHSYSPQLTHSGLLVSYGPSPPQHQPYNPPSLSVPAV